MCVCACVRARVCVCVCVCERERERECVCVSVSVSVCACKRAYMRACMRVFIKYTYTSKKKHIALTNMEEIIGLRFKPMAVYNHSC